MSPLESPGTQVKNPLVGLFQYGQSVWLDYVRRSLITEGELKRLIEEDGLRGVTSNPAIFEKAVTGSTDYTAFLDELHQKTHADAKTLYERLAVRDIQDAADALRPVYQESRKRDGYVSLEVSPFLARDTTGTLDEARRLFAAIARPNVMIKVPGTAEGIPAFSTLISEGINVNVTLLFALEAYEEVANAYLAGLEARAAAGGDLQGVASVASFFISRIDTAIDEMINARLKTAQGAEHALLESVAGKVAIANAKVTYERYKQIFSGKRWDALAAKGAQTQRVLWASTSTKNPHYRDVLYVEELIGRDTVNTIPPATFDAFRDHGRLRESLEEDTEAAHDTMASLAKVGISMEAVTDKLLDDGLKIFSDAFDKLLKAVDQRCQAVDTTKVNRQTYSLPADLDAEVKQVIDDWQQKGGVRRLWARDPSLWTGKDESSWLGWLGIAEEQLENVAQFRAIADAVRKEEFTHALLLGMGGSSLCPEVLKETFGKVEGYPELHVLDSTDPGQIAEIESRIDPKKTLFIVSSKSGSTLEPNIFKSYFFEKAKAALGADKAPSHFIAITDPGSKMQQVASHDHFRKIFPGVTSIGGRYSALSNFGMVPAAVMGLDVKDFLERALEMVHATAGCVPARENPGLVLGAILGVSARRGRDKVTLIVSPGIRDLGAWLEQLLAESTGKEGKGIVPVDREAIAGPDAYGADRVFVYVCLEGGVDPAQESAVSALEKAGQPVVRILVGSKADLGEEFYRWEFATAVAGSVIGINAFNQPDVEASKVATRKLTTDYERTGSLPPETPILEDGGMKLFTDSKNAQALASSAPSRTVSGYLRSHLSRLAPGDYFAVLAYVPMTGEHEKILQSLRIAVRDKARVATCLGFGPRFLHSTGQAYKGGPGSGVFLQITCDDSRDLPVPESRYTFGVVKAAQARGDFEVLTERNRRALRVHIGKDVAAGLEALRSGIVAALS